MVEEEEFFAGFGGDIIPASSGKTNNTTLSRSLPYFPLWVALENFQHNHGDPTMIDIHIATCHTCVTVASSLTNHFTIKVYISQIVKLC